MSVNIVGLLDEEFYSRDVLQVAPELLGKKLWIRHPDGRVNGYFITETEAYRGEEDKACHAAKGFTKRTEIMYGEPGRVYVYLIYGMHWMLNFVTGGAGIPQAVLIRGLHVCNGPGRVARHLAIDRTFYGENLDGNGRMWVTDEGLSPEMDKLPRVGIEYAGEPWISLKWRFIITNVDSLFDL